MATRSLIRVRAKQGSAPATGRRSGAAPRTRECGVAFMPCRLTGFRFASRLSRLSQAVPHRMEACRLFTEMVLGQYFRSQSDMRIHFTIAATALTLYGAVAAAAGTKLEPAPMPAPAPSQV